MVPALLLVAACLAPADNGRSPSPNSKNDPARTVEEEKGFLVGEIKVTGNTRTRQSLILKRVKIWPGVTATHGDLRAAEAALNRLKIFQPGVSVTVLDEDSSEYHTILIMVQERKATDERDQLRLTSEEAVMDRIGNVALQLLEAKVAVPICDWLEDFPIFKVRSGCESVVEDVESCVYLSIAVPLEVLREVQVALGNMLWGRSPE